MSKAIIKTFKDTAKRLFVGIVIGGFILALQASALYAREHPHVSNKLIPEYWEPSLEQLKDTLEESAKTESQTSQQAMNLISQNLADVRDAQLFILYIQLMQTLDARGRVQLFKEQKRWLGKRAELASASVTSKGGSLAPLEYSAAFSKLTEERLVELQKRLKPQQKAQQLKN
jgi:uncharacterized protein YecT (DUF1311 family)